MIKIELSNTPNQKIRYTADGISYDLSFRSVNGVMYASVSADSVTLSTGFRCIPNGPVIPYPHLTDGGNFYFYCDDEHYPDWEKFNDNHVLYYITDEELA